MVLQLNSGENSRKACCFDCGRSGPTLGNGEKLAFSGSLSCFGKIKLQDISNKIQILRVYLQRNNLIILKTLIRKEVSIRKEF